ncbi:MAG: Ku protein [Fimbriimonadaceae bacterium]|nr:Ku protein [Fimbriimonadaceae bacterium]QYK56404.1 MAG: Ku protein [Fimbriimonadaceae bacterium]
MARKTSNDENEEGYGSESTGRPIWTGSISFGLVNVPVSLYSLEQRDEIHFKLLDSRNNAGVKYQRVNQVTGEEVPWDQIVRAYEYSDENLIVISNEELKGLQVESLKQIEVQAFVNRDQVDEMFYEKPYILVPKKKTEKGYVLLREVMERTGRIGIAKVAIRTREYLAALLPRGPGLVVMLMRYASEMRSLKNYNLPDQEPEAYNISEREMLLAEQLVEAMVVDWSPGQYKDQYREALMNWVDEKVKSGGLTPKVSADEATALPEAANVIDLASLLTESVKSKEASGD